jgi:hypothetical protein
MRSWRESLLANLIALVGTLVTDACCLLVATDNLRIQTPNSLFSTHLIHQVTVLCQDDQNLISVSVVRNISQLIPKLHYRALGTST